ncbi:MAG TPA: hypothetical protein VNM14_21910 [Planctomycetota bacterium]|jgi:hypothetical protein|nr:hypothetical protein [Planctomycetota bacterium]
MPLPGQNRPRFNSRKPSEPEPPAAEPLPPSAPPPQDFRRPIHKKRRVIRAQASSGMDPQTMKYLIFFLIFVVGNAILFFSTGFIIIPR